MFDQRDDGSHEITLHNVTCPGCRPYPRAKGVLKWSREDGVSFSLHFPGINSLMGTDFYHELRDAFPGVGRHAHTDLSEPQWTATTDDGTPVRLFGVTQEPLSSVTRSFQLGVTRLENSCGFNGRVQFAVVDIPDTRLIAFENSTEEPFRLFFSGQAGACHHFDQKIEFHDGGTITYMHRCGIRLSNAPRVSLVSAHALVKGPKAGWLAFENAPFAGECEFGAYAERTFVSFLNARKVPFHWADRKQQGLVRRTYYGFIRADRGDDDREYHQPVPTGGIERFAHRDATRDALPAFFQKFVERAAILDFGAILHPLWTSLAPVLHDRMALAAVALERLTSQWKENRGRILAGPPESENSIWKNSALLRTLRTELLDGLRRAVQSNLDATLSAFVAGDACEGLTDPAKTELLEVVRTRIINSLTGPPNSAKLRAAFDDLHIPLSDLDERGHLGSQFRVARNQGR